MKLQHQFPHDAVLQRMIKEEFKDNRVFKYPEEYDVYDDDEEKARRLRGKVPENKKSSRIVDQ